MIVRRRFLAASALKGPNHAIAFFQVSSDGGGRSSSLWHPQEHHRPIGPRSTQPPSPPAPKPVTLNIMSRMLCIICSIGCLCWCACEMSSELRVHAGAPQRASAAFNNRLPSIRMCKTIPESPMIRRGLLVGTRTRHARFVPETTSPRFQPMWPLPVQSCKLLCPWAPLKGPLHVIGVF